MKELELTTILDDLNELSTNALEQIHGMCEYILSELRYQSEEDEA